MTNFARTSAIAAITLFLSACAGSTENPPLVFGKSLTVGIGISGSTPEQSADLTLGVKSKNIAVVPVSLTQQDGSKAMIDSTGKDTSQNSTVREARDALSVLGQFEVKAQQSSPTVSLGEFFATGAAARRLADGFACEMGEGQYCKLPGSKPPTTP